MNNILKSIRIATVGLLLAGSSSIASAEGGACCTPWGCWVTESPILCEMKGGTYQGDGTTCDPDPCGGDSVGACCLPDGSCIDGLLEYECINYDGVTHHPGQFCDEVDCPPIDAGACCVWWMDDCLQMSEEDCINEEGTFHGEGVPCDTVACIGACCLPNDDCVASYQIECGFYGGSYQGGGTYCQSVDCGDAPMGACCFFHTDMDRWMCTQSTESECQTYGVVGSYWHQSFHCNDIACPPVELVGACCWGPFCVDNVTEDECNTYDGGAWLGTGAACAADACSSEPGACCALGECLLTFEDDCISLDGDFYGNGVPCETVNCDPLGNLIDEEGACCLPTGCVVLLKSECELAGGLFTGDTSCDDARCYACVADIDGDGNAGIDDLLIIIGAWNTSDPDADINDDGIVNIDDMLMGMGYWGPCIPDIFKARVTDAPGVIAIGDVVVDSFFDVVYKIEFVGPTGDVVTPPSEPGQTVEVQMIELKLTGTHPDLGELTIEVPSVPVELTSEFGLDFGTLRMLGSSTAKLYCPGIDSISPPQSPYPGADHLEHSFVALELEPFTGSWTLQEDGNLGIQTSAFNLASYDDPPTLYINYFIITAPPITMPKKVYTLPGCAAELRCNRREICIQPVFFTWDDPFLDQTLVSGGSLSSYQTEADLVWNKACIDIVWKDPVYIDENTNELRYVTAGVGNNYSDEEKAVFDKYVSIDCVELFFVEGFSPKHASGDGLSLNGGHRNARIIVADEPILDCNPPPVQIVAHELGHAMGLSGPNCHTKGKNCMAPTGKKPPECPGVNQNSTVRLSQVRQLTNPLITDKTPKEQCCLQVE